MRICGRITEHNVGHQLQLGVRLPELRELVQLPGVQAEQDQEGGHDQRHDADRVLELGVEEADDDQPGDPDGGQGDETDQAPLGVPVGHVVLQTGHAHGHGHQGEEQEPGVGGHVPLPRVVTSQTRVTGGHVCGWVEADVNTRDNHLDTGQQDGPDHQTSGTVQGGATDTTGHLTLIIMFIA